MAAECAAYRDRVERAAGVYLLCMKDVPALRGVCDQTLDKLAECRATLASLRRSAVSTLRRRLKNKPPNEGCKRIPLSCKLTPRNVRWLCEQPGPCMFPTTTTTTTTTTVTTPTTTSSTTTTTTMPMATTPDVIEDRCQPRCINKVLEECFEDCAGDCDGDTCARRLCRRGCRNFNCLELRDRCTDTGTHVDEGYRLCCRFADTCSDEVECTPPETTTTSSTTSTTTIATTTTTTTP